MMMKSFLRGTKDQSMPSADMFSAAQWSVSGISRKRDYDQQDVTDIINSLKVFSWFVAYTTSAVPDSPL